LKFDICNFIVYPGLLRSAGAIKRAATDARTSSKAGLVVDFKIPLITRRALREAK
jgi:hypothetical protein